MDDDVVNNMLFVNRMTCDDAPNDWYYLFECQGTGFRTRYIETMFRNQREKGLWPRQIKVLRMRCNASSTAKAVERCVACVQPDTFEKKNVPAAERTKVRSKKPMPRSTVKVS